jgi:preprotein translocase subunit YajC
MFATNAYAMAGGAQQQSGGSGIEGIVMLVIMFAIFYFLLIRPQQKRARLHKELVQNLKAGDEVVSAGGLHGKIASVQDLVVTLEIASNVRVKVNRSSIVGTKTDQLEQ